MKRVRHCLLATAVACSSVSPAAWAGEYLIGTGMYDITGPVAEIGAFGYASNQEMDGLHQRLRSRAYIIKSPSTGAAVVFASTDQGALFQSVKLEVVKRLKARYGSTYSSENVMLTATHTHVGSASTSHHQLYITAGADKAGYGYSKQTFETVVNGIVQSIVRAHNNLAPGSIELVEGELHGATLNRSLDAYRANVDAAAYPYDTNRTMTVLKFRKDSGKEVGMINWFAVHPTSFNINWTKVSGDNKGYAGQFFERAKRSDYAAAETFVAAFANSDEGDVVPSDGNSKSAPGFEGGPDDYKNAEAAGKRQLNRAVELYNTPGARLNGQLDYRHQWVTMPGFQVRPEFGGGQARQLCRAGRGYSFAAGGENGPGTLPGFYEGMTKASPELWSEFKASPFGLLIGAVAGGLNLVADDPCQYPKPNLLPTGLLNWVPSVQPYQVMVVGKLAIIGLPHEITTMAGRRIRATVLQQLAPKGVTTAVIAGMANTYSGYLTTYEEFNKQHYEGASNEFGPYALDAARQVLSDLSLAIVKGDPVSNATQPPDKSGVARNERPGVLWDGKPMGQSFGQVMSDAKASYARGQEVTVTFRGAHPKNNLRIQGSYLTVERLIGGQWTPVANDWDWETTCQWRREGLDASLVDVTWRIPTDQTAGTYRIRHSGDWKSGLTGAIKGYTGESRAFTVN